MGELLKCIGGLPLPGSLLESVSAGRWRLPESVGILVEVFGEEPDWPQFFDLATMARQNQFFQAKSQAELEADVAGSGGGLGVDPSLAVLVGSLGSDMPIALDYRLGRSDPRVIYLAADGWCEVAPTFRVLCERLNL